MSDFLDEVREIEQARSPRPKHPDGWQPRSEIDDQGGFIVTKPYSPDHAPNHQEALIEFGLDPEQWKVTHVRRSRWETYDERWLEALRINIVPVAGPETSIDFDKLVAKIKRQKPLKQNPSGGDWTYIVTLSDWQLGKRDGDGTRGIVDRVVAGIAEARVDVGKARKEGYPIGRILIVGLGDIVEGCDGFYPMQTFEVELDRRQQMRVARRLVLHAVQELAPLAKKVTVLAIAGNHGENRKGGKAFTSFADNDDVAVFEQVSDILAENPERYGHVNFLIPHDELTVTIDLGGTVVGFTHGHIARASGATGLAHTRVWNWWKGQAHGRSFAGDADVLVNGHFHYFNHCENGARTHIQVPSLDHSTWYEQGSGYAARHGMVTFLSGPEHVERLRILRCRVEKEDEE